MRKIIQYNFAGIEESRPDPPIENVVLKFLLDATLPLHNFKGYIP